jgi:hypothetical protein
MTDTDDAPTATVTRVPLETSDSDDESEDTPIATATRVT